MTVLLSFVLSGCVRGEQRPDPTAVVAEYLAAIAEGDASLARALDAAAIEVSYPVGSPAWKYGDFDRLRSNAVLQGAEERIENVVVDPSAGSIYGEVNRRAVFFTYELAGKKHESSLDVEWNAVTSTWTIQEPLVSKVFFDTWRSSVRYQPARFRIGGIKNVVGPDANGDPSLYLVYPGVYRVAAEIPEDLLVPGTETVQMVVVEGTEDSGARFEVVELPPL